MTENTSATGGYLRPISSDPLEDDELASEMQSLVKGITGLSGSLVRPRWQKITPKQPDIDVDWCGIGVTFYTPDDNISQEHDGEGEGETTTIQQGVFDVMASFYGPSATRNANLLRDGLMIPQNRERLFLNGMALVSKPGPTTSAPDMINNQWRSRCDIAFQIRRTVSRVWAIRNITSVDGTVSANLNGDAIATKTSTPFHVEGE